MSASGRPFAFPRSVRLRRSADFRRAKVEGVVMRTRNLVAQIRPTGSDGPRFGLAVSRKVGGAVVRNRVKRRLRESLRLQRAGLTAVDVVLIARPSAASADFASLFAEVGQVLGRARRITAG